MNALAPQIEIDDDSAALLAKMDARGVEEGKLMVIFRCSAEELAVCREVEAYKGGYAAELLALEERAAQLDNNWDDIEARALGDLKEQMTLGAIVDPRQLLGTAATANKMARRSPSQSADGLERKKAEAERPTINGGQQVIIRLRTKFVKQIDTPAGHAQLLEREAEIETTAPKKIADEMSAMDVRKHLTDSLGIDLNSLKTGGRMGPDEALENIIGTGMQTPLDLPSDMFSNINPNDDEE